MGGSDPGALGDVGVAPWTENFRGLIDVFDLRGGVTLEGRGSKPGFISVHAKALTC